MYGLTVETAGNQLNFAVNVLVITTGLYIISDEIVSMVK